MADTDRLASLRGLSLDFRLGIRLLLRYPGLSIVGGIAMAFAIAVGAAGFEVIARLLGPELPFEDGDRIVALRNWDVSVNYEERRTLHDFVAWREQLRSVEEIGAARNIERNLITAEGESAPILVAETSTSAFSLTGVPPFLGRTLVASDEAPSAPPVIVIGHDVWQSRFAGDPAAIGRTVRLGEIGYTIVGVMPRGYRFPVDHDAWIPLRAGILDHARGAGPALKVFGRLAPDATLEQARAEIAALGRRATADFPDTHEHLRPQVLPYAQSFLPIEIGGALRAGIYSSNIVFVLFLVLICGNVAALMFARTATRENEIVVRNALGASRRRILGQLFVEALVLGALAALLGLAVASTGLEWGFAVLEAEFVDQDGMMPFWWRDIGLSPATVFYAALLTVIGAVVAGVLPARKLGGGLGTRLRQFGAGGGGPRFSGIWSVVIIGQIALTVIFVAFSVYAVVRGTQIRRADLGFPVHEFLSARLETEHDAFAASVRDTTEAALSSRLAAVYSELERRLQAEPGVAGVAYASRLPGDYHGRQAIDVEGVDSMSGGVVTYGVQTAAVASGFFQAFGAPIVAGRGFSDLDAARPEQRVLIVNQAFVKDVLGDRAAVGRRIRFLVDDEARRGEDEAAWGPWHEIVGVVRTITMTNDPELPSRAGVYLPWSPGAAMLYAGTGASLQLAVRLRRDPADFGRQLRSIVSAVDPNLRLYDIRPLYEVQTTAFMVYDFWIKVLVLMSSMALLLSLASIYSVMSFTVSRRTREIGIRTALGADPRRIVVAIFRRPILQAAIGVALPVLVFAVLGSRGRLPSLQVALVMAAFALVMFAVVMLAAIVTVRRALGIQPTEALLAESELRHRGRVDAVDRPVERRVEFVVALLCR